MSLSLPALLTLLFSVYYWILVFSKSIRKRLRRYKGWGWKFSNNEEEQERMRDAFNLAGALLAAIILTSMFIIITFDLFR
jgi:hypothetical protein